MIQKQDKNTLRKVRHDRVRSKISGTPERPRMCVYRSTNHIYVQVIDDLAGNTLVAASTVESALKPVLETMTKAQAAALIGKTAAERALAKGIEQVVFDRGGYLYHGRVAQLAQGAREAGLKF